MSTRPLERQQIVETIQTLPDALLPEVLMFLDYLRYKSLHQPVEKPAIAFVDAIAGIGASGEENISECDEEILGREVDPIYGWNRKSSDLQ